MSHAARLVGFAVEIVRRLRWGPLGGKVGEAGQVLLVGEDEGFGVHAVPQAGWGRAVLEDVAEVGVAAGAENLGADHAVPTVDLRGDVLGSHGLEEAGPAG